MLSWYFFAVLLTNASSSLVDPALPQYNDPSTKERVNQLIIEEMRTFDPPNYLAHIPEIDMQFGGSKALQVKQLNKLHNYKTTVLVLEKINAKTNKQKQTQNKQTNKQTQ